MIKVLQDWREIGQAYKFLSHKELPRHNSAEKCWDFCQLHGLVEGLDRGVKMIDLGCSGVDTLKLLNGMGFENLTGVDLNIGCRDRMWQAVRMWRGRTLRRPFRLYKRDLTRTGFPETSFDVATCISVIEHGVDCEKFLSEASRLLRPGGLLFVTADYWQEKIDVSDDAGEYGMPWGILCRKDVEAFVSSAGRYGFEPCQDVVVPDCAERCVVWHGQEFTFVSLTFKKLAAS